MVRTKEESYQLKRTNMFWNSVVFKELIERHSVFILHFKIFKTIFPGWPNMQIMPSTINCHTKKLLLVMPFVGQNPVLPIALAGRNLEVPASLLGVTASLLGERVHCVCWVRVSAVGELHAELSWINWFSSWVNEYNCSFNGLKFVLILSSITSFEILLVASSIRSELRDARVSAMFSALTDILGYKILLHNFPPFRILRSEKFIKLVTRLILYCKLTILIEAIGIDFYKREVKADVRQSLCVCF